MSILSGLLIYQVRGPGQDSFSITASNPGVYQLVLGWIEEF